MCDQNFTHQWTIYQGFYIHLYYILKGTDISQVDFVLIRWLIPQWKYRQIYVPWSKHGIFSFGHQSHNRNPYDRYIIFYELIAGHTQLYEQFAVPQFWPWHEWIVFMVYKSFTLWLFNTTINMLWKPWPIFRYISKLIYDDWIFPLNCQTNMMDFPLRGGNTNANLGHSGPGISNVSRFALRPPRFQTAHRLVVFDHAGQHGDLRQKGR